MVLSGSMADRPLTVTKHRRSGELIRQLLVPPLWRDQPEQIEPTLGPISVGYILAFGSSSVSGFAACPASGQFTPVLFSSSSESLVFVVDYARRLLFSPA